MSGSVNMVILMGNLTRDPELKFVGGGNTALAKFGLAVNRRYKDRDGNRREEVTFIDVVAWGKTGEIIGEYLKKGDPIFINGRLKLEEWEDKTTGQKRQKLTVVAEAFQFVGKKADREESSGSSDTVPAARAPEDDDVPF